MNKTPEAKRTSAAVIAQLNAEMKAHDFNVKSLAAAVAVDYNTFRRYMNAEREIPMPVLWATLAVMELPIELFASRASERLVNG